MSFDLDIAIATWRRPYEVHPAFSAEDIEELEGSLRDRIEALVAQGVSEKDAFYAALKRAGSYGAAETEYRKVFWGKAKRQHRLLDELLWRLSMIKNYLSIALRTLRRQKGYSVINITGLATGIAASVLILLFVFYETSFDKHHENAENLYRIGVEFSVAGRDIKTTGTPAPLGRTLVAEFPEVVSATRFHDAGRVLLQVEDQRFYEEGFFWADSTVFDLFTIPFVAGDQAMALTQPNTVVLTEEMARKYFGAADPIGKTLRFNNRVDYTVTGVMRPPDANSHLEFDFLGSFITLPNADSDFWMSNSSLYYTYVLLREETRPEDVLAKTPALILKYVASQIEQVLGQSYEQLVEAGLRYGYYLENVSTIYLHSDADNQVGRTGDVQYVYIMSAIAFFILFIAAINFMNLSTASSIQRAKEVGIRKVMGSDRSQLILQFLGESVFMALLALLVAYAMVVLALPVFRSLTGVALTVSTGVVVGMIGIAGLTGLVAGFYPAFVLSAFKPTTVLKGSLSKSAPRSWMQRGLVVTQFAISITLLVGTTVVSRQLQFIQDKDLGFDKDHVVVLPIETDVAAEGFERFRRALLQNPNIVQVAAAGSLPGPGRIQFSTGFRKEGARAEEFFIADTGEVSPEYVETLGLELVAGRSFSRAHPADVEGFIINEAALRAMGWDAQAAIGKRVSSVKGNNDSDRTGPILGVFRDAHFNSLHEMVRPLILGARFTTNVRYMPIRISDQDVRETMIFLEHQWASFEPDRLFNYFFLDEDYERFYEQERRLGEIYGYFTLLAVFIACLGLFGLASFVTQRRTKEIGVRKVLGASVMGMVVLLSKEFTYLVLIAAVFAFPVSYFGMMQWLQNFAYATPIGFDVYVLSGLVAILIAWSTVSYHTIKAATVNPVHVLRYE